MTAEQVGQELRSTSRLNQVRAAFSDACGKIDQAGRQRTALSPIDMRRMEFEAVQKIAAAILDVEVIARGICLSRKFECGQGCCAPLCMSALGDARQHPCPHTATVHKDLATSIATALAL